MSVENEFPKTLGAVREKLDQLEKTVMCRTKTPFLIIRLLETNSKLESRTRCIKVNKDNTTVVN